MLPLFLPIRAVQKSILNRDRSGMQAVHHSLTHISTKLDDYRMFNKWPAIVLLKKSIVFLGGVGMFWIERVSLWFDKSLNVDVTSGALFFNWQTNHWGKAETWWVKTHSWNEMHLISTGQTSNSSLPADWGQFPLQKVSLRYLTFTV